ncbi:hypothetical protein SK128_003117 [Halocaridina rubra]|uniref:Uncharacterized protein n=1 Tax=Halocaridina rubra TaxID=373956 RepID=A0AAN8ZYS7_HALRR
MKPLNKKYSECAKLVTEAAMTKSKKEQHKSVQPRRTRQEVREAAAEGEEAEGDGG